MLKLNVFRRVLNVNFSPPGPIRSQGHRTRMYGGRINAASLKRLIQQAPMALGDGASLPLIGRWSKRTQQASILEIA
jgi:hypothetical protein